MTKFKNKLKRINKGATQKLLSEEPNREMPLLTSRIKDLEALELISQMRTLMMN